jgi:hypothetical protein
MSIVANLFKSKLEPAIENLRSVMAAIDKERTLDRSFAKRAVDLETAVKEADDKFHENPNDAKLLETLLKARRAAADAPALKELAATAAKNHQQEHLERLKEACGPALQAIRARLEGELAEIVKRDESEAEQLGTAPDEMSPRRKQFLMVLDVALILEKRLPTVNPVQMLMADSELRNITSFCLGDNREYNWRPVGKVRIIKPVD